MYPTAATTARSSASRARTPAAPRVRTGSNRQRWRMPALALRTPNTTSAKRAYAPTTKINSGRNPLVLGASAMRCQAAPSSWLARGAVLNTLELESRITASFSPYWLKSPPTRVACSGVRSASSAPVLGATRASEHPRTAPAIHAFSIRPPIRFCMRASPPPDALCASMSRKEAAHDTPRRPERSADDRRELVHPTQPGRRQDTVGPGQPLARAVVPGGRRPRVVRAERAHRRQGADLHGQRGSRALAAAGDRVLALSGVCRRKSPGRAGRVQPRRRDRRRRERKHGHPRHRNRAVVERLPAAVRADDAAGFQ